MQADKWYDYDSPPCKTVGDIKRELVNLPDDMPLAMTAEGDTCYRVVLIRDTGTQSITAIVDRSSFEEAHNG